MNSGEKRAKTGRRQLPAWLDLTLQERKFLLGILAIALVGLAARYLHLRNQQPEPYRPAGVESAERGETR